MDTIPPSIKILNLEDNQWVSNLKKLKVYISDKSSGIKSYNGWINDKWILLEYNPSKGLLTYDFNDNINSSNTRNDLSIKIRESIVNSNYVGLIFNTIGVSDGISMGTLGMRYSLPSRDIIADSMETVVQAMSYDGLVTVVGCDKNMPGALMAVSYTHLTLPTILLV
mgnify:CR=1 FL=1